MSIESFYEEYEPLRLRRKLARTAIAAGKEALSNTEEGVLLYLGLDSGREVAASLFNNPVQKRNFLLLYVNVAEPDVPGEFRRYAEIDLDTDRPEIIYTSRFSPQQPFDEESDREVVSAFEAIRDAAATKTPTEVV